MIFEVFQKPSKPKCAMATVRLDLTAESWVLCSQQCYDDFRSIYQRIQKATGRGQNQGFYFKLPPARTVWPIRQDLNPDRH